MHSSRFLTKKVFPVDNPSAIPLTEISPMDVPVGPKFSKGAAPRQEALRPTRTRAGGRHRVDQLVRTRNIAQNDPKFILASFRARFWVRTNFFDSVALSRARAHGAQRLPPRSGALRKFWAHRDVHGELSVRGMALGLSTGKTFCVRNI